MMRQKCPYSLARTPRSQSGDDGNGVGRRENDDNIGGPVPPLLPPLRTGKAAFDTPRGTPHSGRELQQKGPNLGEPIVGGGGGVRDSSVETASWGGIGGSGSRQN